MKEKCLKKKILLPISIVAAIVAVIIIACAIYLNDYYKADTKAIEKFTTTNSVSKDILEDNTIVYSSENAETGLIFYPGGKVEYIAYEPLMKALASEGIMCVLIEMPFNLAVFDVNAAKGVQEKYQDIQYWYIGGHSLGGSMAASYLSENVNDFEGLILLGSYSTADLSDTNLDVLSVYGSEDKVLNLEKYNENIENLPSSFKYNRLI